MKKEALCCMAGLALLMPCHRAFASEQGAPPAGPNPARKESFTTVASELRELIARIQSKLDQGKNTPADLAEELKGFDVLLAKYAGQKTDDVAEVLSTEAKLYLQVLDDSAKSRQLILRLKREFPLTTQGRNADQILKSITRDQDAARIRSFLVTGSQFPDFAEKDSTRHELSLSAYKGKVVLVHFWASWSKASIADLPTLLALYQKYHEHGFSIIGVSLDDDRLRLSGFTAQNKMPWPQFCDGSRWNNKLAVKYGVNTIPASYLLDREGRIISKDLNGQPLAEQVAVELDKNSK